MKYRSPRDFGNVKMNGKRTMKNPCPCCDTITNESERILVEEIERLERKELEGILNVPKRIKNLQERLDALRGS
jgi:predicted phosphohydrolase